MNGSLDLVLSVKPNARACAFSPLNSLNSYTIFFQVVGPRADAPKPFRGLTVRPAMPSLGVARTHWPVSAWIRLTLPEPPAPITLLGSPPPPDPPLELLEHNPVPTDPRRRVFAYEEDRGDWVLRLIWDADDPRVLSAEFRAPFYGRRPTREQVADFWKAVKEKVAPLGSLPIEAADPRP